MFWKNAFCITIDQNKQMGLCSTGSINLCLSGLGQYLGSLEEWFATVTRLNMMTILKCIEILKVPCTVVVTDIVLYVNYTSRIKS